MQLHKAPNTTTKINNKEYLFFSGTSYLGIPMLPHFQELVTQSVLKWGTSYGSSRSANLKLAVYQKSEQFISTFLNTEDTVTVSSGTLAGQFALRSLRKKVDAFFYMPKTHPAILTEDAKPVFENSEVNSELINAQNKSICILVDAIAALETSPFSFGFLNSISETNTVFILLDESHSLGVLGANGNGISSQIKKAKKQRTYCGCFFRESFWRKWRNYFWKHNVYQFDKNRFVIYWLSWYESGFFRSICKRKRNLSTTIKKTTRKLQLCVSKIKTFKSGSNVRKVPCFLF